MTHTYPMHKGNLLIIISNNEETRQTAHYIPIESLNVVRTWYFGSQAKIRIEYTPLHISLTLKSRQILSGISNTICIKMLSQKSLISAVQELQTLMLTRLSQLFTLVVNKFAKQIYWFLSSIRG